MRNFKTLFGSLLVAVFLFAAWTNPVPTVEKENISEVKQIQLLIEDINQQHHLQLQYSDAEINEVLTAKYLSEAKFACYTQEFLAGLIQCFGQIPQGQCKYYNVQPPNNIINTVDLLWVLAHLCP